MSDARAWETSTKPARMLELHPPGRGRKARLLLVACCRAAWDALTDDLRAAIEIGERWADGRADAHELAQAFSRIEPAQRIAAQHAQEAKEESERYTGWVYQRDPKARAAHRARAEAEATCLCLTVAQAAVRQELWLGALPTAVQLPSASAASDLLRDIFGNPFRPLTFDPAWRTDTAVAVARGMYESRNFGAMPILADALQDAGCENADVLNHCRDPHAAHVRGCWVVDLVLGLS